MTDEYLSSLDLDLAIVGELNEPTIHDLLKDIGLGDAAEPLDLADSAAARVDLYRLVIDSDCNGGRANADKVEADLAITIPIKGANRAAFARPDIGVA